jgi:hypothetical protein
MVDVGGFVNAVQQEYGMRPVVPFEHAIAVGDIGRLGRDGTWDPVSTTRHRFNCVPEGVRKARDGHGTWSASSGKDVTFKAYAKGQTSKLVSQVADAKARAEIEFVKARVLSSLPRG